MWTNPKYDRPEPPAAPVEQGERLATFARNNGNEDLRVTLSEFNGYPYVAVRLWTRDLNTGNWWPTRKGCSLRMGELSELVEALAAVAEPRTRPGRPGRPDAPGDDGPRYVSKRRRPELRPANQVFPPMSPPGTGDDFNEFDPS